MPGYGALAHIDLHTIVARIAGGEYAAHIARELGVAPQSLWERLIRHPAYRDALQIRHQLKLDEAQEMLATSPDLARAREIFRAAAWRAERECKGIWGASAELTGAGGGPIEVRIVRYGEIIDGSATEVGVSSGVSGETLPDKSK